MFSIAGIEAVGDERIATFGWSPFDDAWHLGLFDATGEPSPLVATWPDDVDCPELASRCEALAALGYAPVSDGEDAWQWDYRQAKDGETYRAAFVRVRPLETGDAAALPD